MSRDGVNIDIKHSNRTLTRFTTQEMSEILPDIKDALSRWKTDNHYFYEIVNRTGTSVFIQLAFSSQNGSEELMGRFEQINEFYPAKLKKQDWSWRTVYKTHPVNINENLSEDELFVGLDECLKEIKKVEADIKDKLQF